MFTHVFSQTDSCAFITIALLTEIKTARVKWARFINHLPEKLVALELDCSKWQKLDLSFAEVSTSVNMVLSTIYDQ